MSVHAPDRLSARAARVVRQELVARRLSSALETAGVTRAELALLTGVTEQHVRLWADPEADKRISIADAMAAPAAVRVVLAELVAGEEHVVSLLPTSTSAHLPADVSAAATLVRSHSAVIDRLLTALADGVLDPAERRCLIARLVEHQREVAGLLACVQELEATHQREMARGGLKVATR